MLNTSQFAKDVVLNNKDLAKENETVQKIMCSVKTN